MKPTLQRAACLLATIVVPPTAGAAPTAPGLAFLDDVSLWHSEVNLHEDHTKFNGRYIDGLVIGNGDMLAIEGMTTELTRFDKSRVTDARLHGQDRFAPSGNGHIEHQSRSAKVPLHAFQWVTGPLYTEYPITYGFTLGVEYAAGGKGRVIEPDGWIRERQHRIRHTNIVKNVIEAESLQLTAVDFMVPDRPALVRRITIENTGAVPVESARVFVTFRVDPRNWRGAVVLNRKARTVTPKLPGNELEFYEFHVRRDPTVLGRTVARSVLIDTPAVVPDVNRLMLIRAAADDATAEKGFLRFNVGRLAPGESRTMSVQVVTAYDEAGIASSLTLLDATPVDRLLADTYAHWTGRIAAADALALPLRREPSPLVRDYIDGIRLQLLSCHNRDGSCIDHPYTYNYVFTRSAYDMFHLLLQLGHRDECRSHIDFLKEAMHRLGLRMSYSIEEFRFAQGAARAGEVHTFGNFRTSEYMLFFPLFVRDFEQRFGDEELSNSLLAELQRSLDAQPVVGEGLIAYSFDEISIKRGKPLHTYSPQNAALYVLGAEFTARVAERTGRTADAADLRARAQRVRATTERRFWNPAGFYAYSVNETGDADPRVNIYCQTLPFFYGYLPRDSDRLPAMLANVKRENMFPSHRVSTLPIAGQQSCLNNGNTIGLLLYLMALARDPEAPAVLERMLGDSGTMGTTAEYLTVTNDSLTRGEMLRNYESAFNVIATLEYLRAGPAQ